MRELFLLFSVKVTEGVKYEIWYNKTNDDYSFINTVAAHSVSILPTFQAPKNISDDFGVRLTTFYNVSYSLLLVSTALLFLYVFH